MEKTKKKTPTKSRDRTIAKSFLSQGEKRLLLGDQSGLQLFDLSLRLDPTNAPLLYSQGLSLLEYGSEKEDEKALLLSAKRFRLAAKLKDNYFEAHQAWGHALYLLGKLSGEHHYFIESEKVIRKALSMKTRRPKDLLADLYWDSGRVWLEIAKKSTEASDLNLSMDSFAKAKELLEDLPAEFWIDFGQSALMLGKSINDPTLISKAIDCYKNGVSIAISLPVGWLRLAEAFALLYEMTHDDDHFTQANECFAAAVKVDAKSAELWLNWATILLESGKHCKDPKKIRSAIEKCHRAYGLDQELYEVVGIWSMALSSLGLLTDRVDLIFEASGKLDEIIEDAGDLPEIWFAYGQTLFALGKYFSDLDYTYQAIEKFQEGLSIDRTEHKLWHALGRAYTSCAQLEQDSKTFELADRFYRKALSLQVTSQYLYDHAFSLFKAGEMTDNPALLELSICQFEEALSKQKNALYLHPDWLFEYAGALDHLGDLNADVNHFARAIEILGHVLMVDPEFPEIHYRLGLVYNHFADEGGNHDAFERALHHYRLAHSRDEENDQIILDWAITLVNYTQHLCDEAQINQFLCEAELKMMQAAKLGNTYAYYQLACLYSLMGNLERAVRFLYKAQDAGVLPSMTELLEDEWLDSVRSTDLFRIFLEKLETSKH